MHVRLHYKSHDLVMDVAAEGDGYRVTKDGTEHSVGVVRLSDTSLTLIVDGHRYRTVVARRGRDRLVAVNGETYAFATESAAAAPSVAGLAPPEITAPMPGKVLQLLVQPGDHVEPGDGLLILEAMKMENRLVAEAAGTVVEVRTAEGDTVDGGQTLVILRYDETPSAGAA